MKYIILAAKAFLTLAFVAAGLAKLAGAEMMVATFEAVGVGQWFRYLTGIIEIAGAALLWVNGRQAIGAGLLAVTMVGAILAHFLFIGPSAMPAVVLGIIAALVFWQNRHQVLA